MTKILGALLVAASLIACTDTPSVDAGSGDAPLSVDGGRDARQIVDANLDTQPDAPDGGPQRCECMTFGASDGTCGGVVDTCILCTGDADADCVPRCVLGSELLEPLPTTCGSVLTCGDMEVRGSLMIECFTR